MEKKPISDIALKHCGFYLSEHARYDYLLNLAGNEDKAKAIKEAMQANFWMSSIDKTRQRSACLLLYPDKSITMSAASASQKCLLLFFWIKFVK